MSIKEAKINVIAEFVDAIHKQYRRGTDMPEVQKWVLDMTAELLIEKLEAVERNYEFAL